MDFNIGVIIFSILNLLVIYWFLKKKFFDRITNFMNNRTDSIQNNINSAKTKLQESESMKLQYETQLSNAEMEGRKIVEEFKIKAQKLSDEMTEEAKRQANIIRERSKIDAEREMENARDEIKRQIITLSLLAASKSIGQQLDAERHHNLIKEFIVKAGV